MHRVKVKRNDLVYNFVGSVTGKANGTGDLPAVSLLSGWACR